MIPEQGPPPVPDNLRMPLRIGTVIVAYILYRVLESKGQMGAVFIALGFLIFDWAVIDYLTKWRRDRSGLMGVGAVLLALGLAGTGLYLIAR